MILVNRPSPHLYKVLSADLCESGTCTNEEENLFTDDNGCAQGIILIGIFILQQASEKKIVDFASDISQDGV